jgi:hypothetical protein
MHLRGVNGIKLLLVSVAVVVRASLSQLMYSFYVKLPHVETSQG